jgi:cytochrome c-type biogenesis protein CcmH
MAGNSPAAGRLSPASIALGVAALLAAAAVGIALSRPGEPARTPPPEAAPAAAPTLDQSIAALRERLRRDPDSDRDWHLLGLALRESGDFAAAGQAFRRAMELAPGDPDHAAYAGEMLLLGRRAPADEARRLFRRALELQPGNPQARYYLATMKDRDGRHGEAVDELIALLRDAPPGASWEPQVRDAVTLIARRNRIDLAGRLPPPAPTPAASTATAAIPGPTREQMEEARAIPPGEQQAMVRAMVDRLAARLRRQPRDADGWIRLMRSYRVLEEPAAARDALRSGLAAFDGDPPTQARLRSAADELGIPAG